MGTLFNPYGVNPQYGEPLGNLQDLLVNSSQIGGLDIQPIQDYQPVSVGAGRPLDPPDTFDPFNMQYMPGYGVPERMLSGSEIEQRDKFSRKLREIAKIQSLVEAASIEDKAKQKIAQEEAFAREVRRIELAEAAEQRRRDGWEFFGPGGIASYKGISGAVAEPTRGEPLMSPQDSKMLGDILGKEGGFESLRRNYSMENANILRRIPIFGGAFGYTYDREIREAKERLANKDIAYGSDIESDPQYRLDVDAVTRHENDQNLLAARGQDFMGKTAEIAGQSLPFAIEFGIAGGPATKLASRVIGGGQSTAAKAGRVLVDAAGRTAVAFPRSFEQAERFQEEYEVIPNELGELEARLTEAGDSEALALLKGVSSMYAEVLFERGGEVVGHLSKAIMKAIPDGASRKYLEDAAKRVGSSKFGKVMEVLNQYGIQGPFAEYYLEEYPVGIVNTLVGLDVEAQRSGESFADRLGDAAAPSFVDEQAPALAAFAIPVLGAAGLSGVAQAQQNARRKWLMENSNRLVEEYGIHPKRAEQIAAEFGKGNRDSAIRMVQEERTKMYLRQELSKPLAEKEGEINPDDIRSTYQDLKESGFSHSDIMREINIRLKARYKAERQAFARMSALEGDSKKTEKEAEAEALSGPRGQGDLLVEEMRSKYGATDSVALEIFRRLGNAAQTPEEVRDVQLQVAQYIGTTGLTPIEGGMPSVEQLRAEAEEQDAIQVGEAEAVPMGEGAGGGPQVDEGVRVKAEDQVPQEKVTPDLVEVNPSTLLFRESQQNRTEQLKALKTEEFSPVVLIKEKDGTSTILDGHNRAKLAKERGENIGATYLSREDYDRLSSAGFDDIEIAYAALSRMEDYSGGDISGFSTELVKQFPGSNVDARGIEAKNLLEQDSLQPTTPEATRPQVDEGVQSEIEKIEKAIAEKETEGQVADEVVEPTTGAMGQQPGGDQGIGPEVGGAGQPGIVQPGVAPAAGGEQQVQQEAGCRANCSQIRIRGQKEPRSGSRSIR
jgi:hypothetical protein